MNKIFSFFLFTFFLYTTSSSFGQACSPSFSSTAYSLEDVTITGLFAHTGTGRSTNGYGDFYNNATFTGSVESGNDLQFTVRCDFTGGNTQYIRVFIDYNNDGTWDQNELRTMTNPPSLTFSVTTQAMQCGEARVRVMYCYNIDDYDVCEAGAWGEAHDYKIVMTQTGNDMAYVSSNGIASPKGVVGQATIKNEVLAFKYTTSGCSNPFEISSIDFSYGLGDNVADVTNATLYYYHLANFAAAKKVGNVVVSPTQNFTISNIDNDITLLNSGDNFFWLVYDIAPNAINGNFVDAEVIAINTTENGGSQNVPTNPNPVGSREIIYQQCVPVVATGTAGEDFELNSYSIANFASRAAADGFNSFTETGYNNYSTTDSLVLCAGSDYDFAANTTNWNTTDAGILHLWADWNQDGDFDDQDEDNVLGVTGLGTVILSITNDFIGEIHVPEHAKNGYTVARVGITSFAKNISCGNFDRGEFDDILIRVNSFETTTDNYAFNEDASAITLPTSSALSGYTWQNSADLISYTDVAGSNDALTLDVTPTNLVAGYKLNKIVAECPNDVDGNTFVQSGITEVLKVGLDSVIADPLQVCVGDSSYLKSYYGFKSSVIEDAPAANILGQGAAYTGTITVPNTEVVSKFNLSKVCIEVTSSLIEELSFELESPSGQKVMLTNGSSVNAANQNYNFCLMLDTALVNINDEIAVLAGNYQPLVSWSRLSGNASTGDWLLNILSSNDAVDATLNSWSMKFGHNDSVNWTDPTNFFNANLDSSKAQVNTTQFFTANLKSDLVATGFFADSVQVVGNDPGVLDVDRFESNDGDFLLCAGADKHVKVFLTNPIIGDNYTWFVNDVAVPGENRDSIIINSLNNGDKLRVEFSLTNGCGTLFATDSIELFNKPLLTPIIDLTSSITGALCDPTDFTIDASYTDTLSQAIYSWKVNATEVAQKVNTYNFAGLNNGDSIFVSVSQMICGTSYLDVDTFHYQFTPRVDILGGLVGDAPEFCEGNISLSFDSTGNNTSGQFYWILDSDTISTDDAINMNDLGTGTYSLIVEYTPQGCYTASNISEQFNFSVLEVLTPAIEIFAPIDTLCPFEGVTIVSTTLENEGTNPTYTWYQNGVVLNFENNDSLEIVNQTLAKTYYVELESSYMCPTTTKVTSNTVKIDVQKDAVVKLNAQRNSPELGCEKGDVLLIGSISRDPADYYYWTANDTIIPNSNSLTPTFARDSGTYEYRFFGVRNFVCAGVDTIASAEIISFTNYTEPDSVFAMEKIDGEYFASINETSEEASAMWYLNGKFISGSNNPQIVFTEEENILCVEVSIANTCVSSSCQSFSFVGINELSTNTVAVYPNPSHSVLNVIWNARQNNEWVEYTIINQVGKTIKLGELNNSTISVEDLAKGSYILQLKSNDSYAIKRFEKL